MRFFKRLVGDNDYVVSHDTAKRVGLVDDQSTEYVVRVDEYSGGEYTLAFDTRQPAREYKKVLRASKRHLQARIFKVEMDGQFIAAETEVW